MGPGLKNLVVWLGPKSNKEPLKAEPRTFPGRPFCRVRGSVKSYVDVTHQPQGLFWREGSPTKIDYRKRLPYPFSNFSTGGLVELSCVSSHCTKSGQTGPTSPLNSMTLSLGIWDGSRARGSFLIVRRASFRLCLS